MTPLPVRAAQMPRLAAVRFKGMFLEQGLVTLLADRRDTLASVELEDVFGAEVGGHGGLKGDASWATLFACLRDARPPRLRRFVARGLNAPLVHRAPPAWSNTSDDKRPRPEGDEVKAVRAALAADPERRVFPYALLDPYGSFVPDAELNVDIFLRGEDQAAYDGLMELVAANDKKASQ